MWNSKYLTLVSLCFTREQTEFSPFVKDSLISLVTRYEWIYHSSARNLAWIARKKEILINRKDLILIHYPQKYAGDSGKLFWAQAWTHTFRRENWTNKTTLTLSLFYFSTKTRKQTIMSMCFRKIYFVSFSNFSSGFCIFSDIFIFLVIVLLI